MPKEELLSMPEEMQGKFECTVYRAVPAVYDSRFDTTRTDKAFGGRVKRRSKCVKKGDVVEWVGFESRGQFKPLDSKTEEINRRDKKMLIDLLSDIGADLTGNESLHQLGKSYNFYDPRLAHVRQKHQQITEKVPIIKLKGEEVKTKPNEKLDNNEPSDEPTNAELRQQIFALGGKCGPNDNKSALKEILAKLIDPDM